MLFFGKDVIESVVKMMNLFGFRIFVFVIYGFVFGELNGLM